MLARVTRATGRSARARNISFLPAWRQHQKLPLVRRFATKKEVPPSPPTPSSMPTGRVTKAMVMHELKEILKLVVGGTVAIVALVASSGYVIETTKQWNPMVAPGTLVDITDDDGRTVTIHVQQRGRGDFTVVFDGGVGETSFDWEKVADQVAQFATVVCIDRPGLGFSPPGPLPRTASQIACEYVALLEKLDVSNNVILVGHGAGGYNMRHVAAALEQPTASSITCNGLVLVDALQEDLRTELESLSPVVCDALATMDANGATVLTLSRFGIIRMIHNIQRQKLVDRYSQQSLPFVESFLPSPAHREGAMHENAGIPITEAALRDANSSITARGFAFPCVVLSHTTPDLFDSMKADPRVDAATVAAMERKWQHAQQLLVQTVSRNQQQQQQSSVHVPVRDAGHNIQHDAPDDVVRVVRALVKEAQESGAPDGLASL